MVEHKSDIHIHTADLGSIPDDCQLVQLSKFTNKFTDTALQKKVLERADLLDMVSAQSILSTQRSTLFPKYQQTPADGYKF